MAAKAQASPTKPPKGAKVPEERVRSLYIGALESFTAERNKLAGELDGKAAAWVKKLPKPSRAAWLANQLSARKPKQVEELLGAAEELRDLQGYLSDPDRRDDLREAARRQEKAIDTLVSTAQNLGREHKAGPQILERVGQTLQAAALDPEVGEALRRGLLVREEQRSGLGFGPGKATGARKGTTRRATGAEKRREQEEARKRREQERKLKVARREVEKRAAAVEKARENLTEKERALQEAERDARRLEGPLED